MADILFIEKFLNQPGVEGPRQTRGYIPCRPRNFTGVNQDPAEYTAIGASGVTIATGCDLGQTDVETLESYGLDDSIISPLIPYLGKKKAAAIQKLSELPLKISDELAAEIDYHVHRGYLDRWVRPAYERDSSGVKFDDLPKEAQTVIFSTCYQKGCGGVRKEWPKLWGYLTEQNWADASNELTTGFQQYAARRRMEGELLKGAL